MMYTLALVSGTLLEQAGVRLGGFSGVEVHGRENQWPRSSGNTATSKTCLAFIKLLSINEELVLIRSTWNPFSV